MSTAMAKGLIEFVNPYRLPKFTKQVSIQMRELEGRQPFGKGLYHSNHYENLIKMIVPTRAEYRNSKDLAVRQDLAEEEFTMWGKYIGIRLQEMPEENQLSQQMAYEMKKTFELYLQRNESKLQPKKLLDVFNEYTKIHQFNIPIDNWCVLQMIHYQMGYMLQLNRLLEYNELVKMLQIKCLATYEKSLGQDLLFKEICSYAYWNLFDQRGYMNAIEFSNFMKIFKINVEPTITGIQREFRFAVNLHQGEFNKDIDEREEVVRFDFFRYLFLERNL